MYSMIILTILIMSHVLTKLIMYPKAIIPVKDKIGYSIMFIGGDIITGMPLIAPEMFHHLVLRVMVILVLLAMDFSILRFLAYKRGFVKAYFEAIDTFLYQRKRDLSSTKEQEYTY